MNNVKIKGRAAAPQQQNVPAGQIDLTPKQQAIMRQIQQDQADLSKLEEMKAQLVARINASRGKLDLIAELAEEYGARQPPQNEGGSQ